MPSEGQVEHLFRPLQRGRRAQFLRAHALANRSALCGPARRRAALVDPARPPLLRKHPILANFRDTMPQTVPQTDPALVAAILDMAADAIICVGPDDRILSCNRGAEKMFGWTARELAGQAFAILLPEEELARGEIDWMRRTTIAQGSLRDYETRRKTKDGRIVDVSITRTAVYDDSVNLIGYSAILRDISDRKRIERQLLTAERLATAGQVAAGVAHEIGAPLTAISVAVDHMLQSRCNFCGGGEEMQVLLSQTDRIAKLARRLVNLAKPAGLVFTPTSANEVVEQATSLVQPQLGRHRIRLELALEPDLPAIHADEAQLQQVLINLFLNAQRAMADSGGVLKVATCPNGHDTVEIVVSDNGPGIAEADLPHIFTPFFSRSGGTGLGLALAAQIVKSHRGTIDVASQVGQGATFTIRIPASASHD
jgi:PAS domain S-box-containing protein